MSRYLPAILGVLVIVGLTIPQFVMTDRLANSNEYAKTQAELLSNIPKKFGDWVGEDLEIGSEEQSTAGAVGAISRLYRNTRTGDNVNLWLIVGHARPISAHTPDICYPSAGFVQRAPEHSLHPFAFPGQDEAPFWTNTFVKEDITGRQLIRVFWSWYNPLDDDAQQGMVHWQAAKNARWHFGNTRALFKMYFTSVMRDPKETTEESPCSRFARDFLPIVDKTLAQVDGKSVSQPRAAEDPAEAEQPEAETPDGAETPADAETTG